MPELPEVETIRRQLAPKIIGKKLLKKKIKAVRRRAKILIIDFNDGSSLAFHLKLTGQVLLNGNPGKFTRHIFKFNDGSRMLFNDQRKFGWWRIMKSTKKMEDGFGPEALEINITILKRLLKRWPNARIKQFLMDQKIIAGIGNIYSDEILFTSRIHPLRRTGTLKEKEIKALCPNIKKILYRAIERKGSSVDSYLDAQGLRGDFSRYHRVYQKEGLACCRCKTKIKRIKLSGRSAHYCPKCQFI